jgi:hypothetical protein
MTTSDSKELLSEMLTNWPEFLNKVKALAHEVAVNGPGKDGLVTNTVIFKELTSAQEDNEVVMESLYEWLSKEVSAVLLSYTDYVPHAGAKAQWDGQIKACSKAWREAAAGDEKVWLELTVGVQRVYAAMNAPMFAVSLTTRFVRFSKKEGGGRDHIYTPLHQSMIPLQEVSLLHVT